LEGLKSVLYVFLSLAAAGFVASLAVHLLAFAGFALPGARLVWALHLGIFAVWLPAVLVANRLTRENGGRFSWKLVLSGCPLWMVRALYILFAYTALNFVLLLIAVNSHPTPGGSPMTTVVRGYSGHCMMFYGAAFAILYSYSARGTSGASRT
jgi:hypothetical protein